MLFKKKKKPKQITFEKMCDMIEPGSRIFISSGPSTPIKTVANIKTSDHNNLDDLELIQLLTLGNYFNENGEENQKFRLKTFNVGESISKVVQGGNIDFIPSHISEIPFLFASNAVGVDVAIVQTSPPDNRGFLNLGIVMDVADLAIKHASLVIAEVNPNVPATYGETSVHIDQVDYIVESDIPLIEREKRPLDDVINRIGWHVSNLIEDESTVSLHVGRLFDAVAAHLTGKKDLRIYTIVVSDWIIDLIESGAIAFGHGIGLQGAVTTSSCFGSKKLYDYVHGNPFFHFVPLLRATYQRSIPNIRKLVGIINVKKIDTTGNSVVLNSGDYHLSGYDGKLVFSLGAVQSRDGKAIVALRSEDKEGNSNIVISHKDTPDRIRSALGTTQYVVTEYGVANLIGKSIRERTLAMIDIAHPDHREQLLEDAKTAGYIYPDQIYVKAHAIHYPFSLETVKTFRGGLEVKFRPIKPSDEDMMRRLFYKFSEQAKYMRYFSPIRTMPHKDMQRYLDIDYTKTLSLVGVIQDHKVERIVAEGRYAYIPSDKGYEMAFAVDEEMQGKGIASFMLDYLLKIAKERDVQCLVAYMLPENTRMARVFESARIMPEKNRLGDEVQYIFSL